MKKQFKFFSALFAAAAMMASCSNDEPIAPGADGVSDGQPRYLSVNILSANGAGSRAVGDEEETPQTGDQVPGDPSGSLYEAGLSAENNVSKVRFYFFDAEGNASAVRHDSDKNYYDWTPDGKETAGMPKVEKILDAVVVISTKEGDELPTYMAAIVNPRNELTDASLSVSALRNIVADYAAYANGGKVSGNTIEVGPNYFPMYNSVYADETSSQTNQIVKVTKIDTEHYCKTSDAALLKPVEIYVERNVAKVRVYNRLVIDPTTKLIKLQTKDGDKVSDITFTTTDDEGETYTHQIYLDLKGWNTTADMNRATLSKIIEEKWKSEWTNEKIGFIWNNKDYYRCYWAKQYDAATNRFGDYDAASEKPFFDGKNKGYKYANENTATEPAKLDASSKRNTKVILSGRLCDEKGNDITLCEYYGVKFIDDKNQSKLKGSVLNYLTDNGKGTIYYRPGKDKDGKDAMLPIDIDDITFYTVTEAGEHAAGTKDSYYVLPVLNPDKYKNDDEDNLWYTSGEQDPDHSITIKELNDILKKTQHAKIWNEGMTYYYTDIEHFAKKKGVVRNHIYDLNINAIYGLGTPVWNPKEPIYPEKTENDDTYIAAEINILSWRVVKQDVVLDWK